MKGGQTQLDLPQFQAALAVRGGIFAEALFRKLDAGETLRGKRVCACATFRPGSADCLACLINDPSIQITAGTAV